MPTYNPVLIEKYAAHLYKSGSNIIWKWGCIGMALGVVAASLVSNALLPVPSSIYGIGLLFAGVAGGLYVGRSIGTDRAAHLFLQAQTALCQVEIERNTRQQ